jgi:hypothetical protein
MHLRKHKLTAAIAVVLGISALGPGFVRADGAGFPHPASGTPFPAMMEGRKVLAPLKAGSEGVQVAEGYDVKPVFTIGEAQDGYLPPGVLDGLGAFPLGLHASDEQDAGRVRILANHELEAAAGYPYLLANGTRLTGARVSYFDLDRTTRRLAAAGLAYDTIYDRRGRIVTHAGQVNELALNAPGHASHGLDRFCSAAGYDRGEYGFDGPIFFSHEETSVRDGHPHGGSVWATDVANRTLWAVPELGRGAWENVTALATPTLDRPAGQIALLLGDDYGSKPGEDADGDGAQDQHGAPLYLWVGDKVPGSFIERNGLAKGTLSVWVEDPEGGRDRMPETFNGTGQARTGRFVPIATRDPASAGQPGHDTSGYKDDVTLRQEALKAEADGGKEAFAFSRPEDLHTSPADGTRVVLASTGRGEVFPADTWGTVYLLDLHWDADASGRITGARATITILYDGDDGGGGRFASPAEGLRNPDNLVWAGDGQVYVQEDRAVPRDLAGAWGGPHSDLEASIWRLDPAVVGGSPVRVAMMDRTAVAPPGSIDSDAGDLGDWESSGIIDVTGLFDTLPGETLLMGTVQAHSLIGGVVESMGLTESGQLFFLDDYGRIEAADRGD